MQQQSCLDTTHPLPAIHNQYTIITTPGHILLANLIGFTLVIYYIEPFMLATSYSAFHSHAHLTDPTPKLWEPMVRALFGYEQGGMGGGLMGLSFA